MEKTLPPNETQELISVIIPAYMVEDYIGKCLDSVTRQTYQNIEIIVIDDGSPDRSGKIADEYAERDERIRVFHKENGGLSDARNFGIGKARGTYVTCVDSDDFIDSDYVGYLYRTLKQYSAEISFCRHRVIFPSGGIEDHGQNGSSLIPAKECIERIMYDDGINTSAWAKLYKKTLFTSAEYPKGMLFEDIGTTYKLILRAGTAAVGYESKYNYILRGNSIVYGNFTPEKLDLLTMTDRMAADVLKEFPDLENAVIRRQVYARFSTLNRMLDESGYKAEKAELIAFIKNHQKRVLEDPKAPKRDKLAIILLDIGYPLYRSVWKAYLKRRGLK